MRSRKLRRRTKETCIEVSLEIDGAGRYDVALPRQFSRHMVETLARYAGWNLKIRAVGDNPHHVEEDVAIVLGKAFRDALGDAPVERIAHAVVPMDDALVLTAVDIVDRPFCHAPLPDPDYVHFLRSFAMDARINLHVDILRGTDEHHIVEAAFKSLGMALRQAARRTGDVKSTKSRVEWSE